jgi:hypothetical protein
MSGRKATIIGVGPGPISPRMGLHSASSGRLFDLDLEKIFLAMEKGATLFRHSFSFAVINQNRRIVANVTVKLLVEG